MSAAEMPLGQPMDITHKNRRRGVAKNCPDRARCGSGTVSRGFTPGWLSWPYRPESQRGFLCSRCFLCSCVLGGLFRFRVLLRSWLRLCPVAFAACKASSISLA
jgi:hypothetical protein